MTAPMAAPLAAPRQAAKSLTGTDLLVPTASVIALYCSVLCGLHLWGQRPATDGTSAEGNFWGTLPSAWDHPEPNYLVSNVIGEFWSVLTTIPVAGVLLTYQGLRYGYGSKVFRIYIWTCLMYTLAFTSHLCLQKHIFSTTVTSVMSNALLTFAQFSGIVHRVFRSAAVRGSIVLVVEVALISTVAWLPYALPANGGVWTLFAVQSPGVFIATGIATALYWTAKRPEEKVTYRTVFQSGLLLSSAMVLSCIECLIGFDYGFIGSLYGFPWLHIMIHVSEQTGIYLYGVGVASLYELLFQEKPREGAEVRYATSWGMPYLYCPYPAGEAPAAMSKAAEAFAEGKTKEQDNPNLLNAAGPVALDKGVGLKQRRGRAASPGATSRSSAQMSQ